jgi:hypothetical protein
MGQTTVFGWHHHRTRRIYSPISGSAHAYGDESVHRWQSLEFLHRFNDLPSLLVDNGAGGVLEELRFDVGRRKRPLGPAARDRLAPAEAAAVTECDHDFSRPAPRVVAAGVRRTPDPRGERKDPRVVKWRVVEGGHIGASFDERKGHEVGHAE